MNALESQLRHKERLSPCPSCGRPTLTEAERRRGHQCRACAAGEEGRFSRESNPTGAELGAKFVDGVAGGAGAALGFLALGSLIYLLSPDVQRGYRGAERRSQRPRAGLSRLFRARRNPLSTGEVVQVSGPIAGILGSPVAEVVDVESPPQSLFSLFRKPTPARLVLRSPAGKEVTTTERFARPVLANPGVVYAAEPAVLDGVFRNPIRRGDVRLVYLPADLAIALPPAVATGRVKGEGPMALYEFRIAGRGSKAGQTRWLTAFQAIKPETLTKTRARLQALEREGGDYVAPLPPPGVTSDYRTWRISAQMRQRGQFAPVRQDIPGFQRAQRTGLPQAKRRRALPDKGGER